MYVQYLNIFLNENTVCTVLVRLTIEIIQCIDLSEMLPGQYIDICKYRYRAGLL